MVPDPYNPFTDEVVLARLKKSPVKGFRVSGERVFRDYWRDIGHGFDVRPAACPSDADHIAMAWMVELAKAAFTKQLIPRITPTHLVLNHKPPPIIFVKLWRCHEGNEEMMWNTQGQPIRALAEVLDWLEGEKT